MNRRIFFYSTKHEGEEPFQRFKDLFQPHKYHYAYRMMTQHREAFVQSMKWLSEEKQYDNKVVLSFGASIMLHGLILKHNPTNVQIVVEMGVDEYEVWGYV
jgi:hypothetical protein